MGFIDKLKNSIKKNDEKEGLAQNQNVIVDPDLVVTMDDLKEYRDENFNYLENLLQSNGEIKLDANIVYEKGVDDIIPIVINGDNTVIEGRDHTIDYKGNMKHIECDGKGIIFKDITFINSKGITVIKNALNSEVKFINCVFSHNQSRVLGGSIFNEGRIEFENCVFNNNLSFNGGGAIHNEPNAIVKISNCKFHKNYALKGSAISNFGNISISNTEFLENLGAINKQDDTPQGTIHNDDSGIIKISNCIFKLNSADLGGVLFNLGRASLSNSLIEENESVFGAVNNNPGATVKIKDCTFEKNNALQIGGAIMNFSECDVMNCNFLRNRAGIFGGAIACQLGAKLSYENCNFEENTPDNIFDAN